MARKGENIFKRKDGRWEARYIHHHDSNGRAVYGYAYGKTYSDAKKKRQELVAQCDPLSILPQKVTTLEALCAHWLADVKISVKESTFAQYHRLVTKYILPRLGDVPPEEITPKVVSAFVEGLLQRGGMFGAELSPKTVSGILTVLKSIFKFGVQNEFVARGLEGVRYPAREGKSIKILTEENRKTLEGALTQGTDAVELGILISLFTGMRLGEVCGLTWQDVDLQARVIYVQRTVERIKNLDGTQKGCTKLIICEPKTQSSVRCIPIPRYLFSRLREYHNKAAPSREGACFVLSGTDTPVEPNVLYNRYKKIMRAHGMNEYSFHALRHTFATRCVEAGFDAKSLAEILGHRSIATTLSVYVHPSMAQKRRQMDKLGPS
jgi:integrase